MSVREPGQRHQGRDRGGGGRHRAHPGPPRAWWRGSASRRSRCDRPPTVGVLSTGDELREGPAPLPRGAIRDGNRPMLLALVAEAGLPVVDLGIVPDDEAALRDVLAEAARTCDAVVTSGGVSVGDLDIVRMVLSEVCGPSMRWMQVAIRPAKPLGIRAARRACPGVRTSRATRCPRSSPSSCSPARPCARWPGHRAAPARRSPGRRRRRLPAAPGRQGPPPAGGRRGRRGGSAALPAPRAARTPTSCGPWPTPTPWRCCPTGRASAAGDEVEVLLLDADRLVLAGAWLEAPDARTAPDGRRPHPRRRPRPGPDGRRHPEGQHPPAGRRPLHGARPGRRHRVAARPRGDRGPRGRPGHRDPGGEADPRPDPAVPPPPHRRRRGRFRGGDGGVEIEARVESFGQTGVEMEALTACAAAALAICDLCRAADPLDRSCELRVWEKRGGRSGTWRYEGAGPAPLSDRGVSIGAAGEGPHRLRRRGRRHPRGPLRRGAGRAPAGARLRGGRAGVCADGTDSVAAALRAARRRVLRVSSSPPAAPASGPATSPPRDRSGARPSGPGAGRGDAVGEPARDGCPGARPARPGAASSSIPRAHPAAPSSASGPCSTCSPTPSPCWPAAPTPTRTAA